MIADDVPDRDPDGRSGDKFAPDPKAAPEPKAAPDPTVAPSRFREDVAGDVSRFVEDTDSIRDVDKGDGCAAPVADTDDITLDGNDRFMCPASDATLCKPTGDNIRAEAEGAPDAVLGFPREARPPWRPAPPVAPAKALAAAKASTSSLGRFRVSTLASCRR